MWDYEMFKRAVYKISGINLTEYKERQMKRRIDSLIRRSGYEGYNDFYGAISRNKDLYRKFINHLTINVSEFYRNSTQWDKLHNEILPNLMELNVPLKFWSSACSTGEEPYSLVMALSEFLPLEKINVLASDIDEEALKKAVEGVYFEKSLENLPEKYIERFFDKKDGRYYIKEKVKKCVQFKKLNLLEDPFPARCHLILCRNVMIYFTDEAKDKLYRKFHDSLVSDGYLFVGSTEQIINCSDYRLKSLKNFFYQRED